MERERAVLKKFLELEVALRTTQILMILHIVVGLVAAVFLLLNKSFIFFPQRHLLNASIATIFLASLSGVLSVFCSFIRIFSIEKQKKLTIEKFCEESLHGKKICSPTNKFLIIGDKMRQFSKKTSLLGKLFHASRRVLYLSSMLIFGTEINAKHKNVDLISATAFTGNIFYFISFVLLLIPLILEKKYKSKSETKNFVFKLSQWHFVVIMFIGHVLNYLRDRDIIKDIVLKSGLTILPGEILVIVGMLLHLKYSINVLHEINRNCSLLTEKLHGEMFFTENALLCCGAVDSAHLFGGHALRWGRNRSAGFL